MSTENSRGSTETHPLGVFAARGGSPQSSAEECPHRTHLRLDHPLVGTLTVKSAENKAKMETTRLLREHAGTQHDPHSTHRDHISVTMSYAHPSSGYTQILASGPETPMGDVMSERVEFELAFTGVEMGVHIAGTVVVSALIALSVWLTIANVML